jgi:hypothetical protein
MSAGIGCIYPPGLCTIPPSPSYALLESRQAQTRLTQCPSLSERGMGVPLESDPQTQQPQARPKKLDGNAPAPASIRARARYAEYCALKGALSKANQAMTSDLTPSAAPTLVLGSCVSR